ncbi:hypothetical protein M758_12G102100 [Ceratodon purpureus]|nr:hypothetical protein M758_12G102100 [Ceratodon purpureus]
MAGVVAGAQEGAMAEAIQHLLPSLPSAVVADLLSIGVCTRCVFRFLNVRSVDFAGSIPSPSALLAELKPVKSNGSVDTSTADVECDPTAAAIEKAATRVAGNMKEPCVVCLGALHLLVDDGANLKQIEDVVAKDGYVFDKFCLEVSVPAVSVVRERSLWFYLKEKYPKETMFSAQYESSSIVSLKEAIKWSLITPLESKLAAKFDANALLRIALLYKHSTSLTDLNFIHHSSGDAKRRRYGYEAKAPAAGLAAVAAERSAEAGESVAAVTRALATMTSKTFSRHFPSPPPQVTTPCDQSIMCWRMPVFVGGRYLKFSRNISQSRWMIDDERMGEGSVQEVIGNVVFPHYKGDSYKFHAAGREDIDVRMLGPGRPFIVEISNARCIPDSSEMVKLEAEINGLKEGWVKVRELRQVGIESCAIMREGESEKQKEYAAVVWLSRPVTQADFEALSSLKELELQQKTPVRVLHRRSPLIRPRTIHWMRCEEIKGSPNYFLLFLCTQAGTYIKEFVHGDLGRTYPNVGSILNCEADILQLDVMDVKMDFL